MLDVMPSYFKQVSWNQSTLLLRALDPRPASTESHNSLIDSSASAPRYNKFKVLRILVSESCVMNAKGKTGKMYFLILVHVHSTSMMKRTYSGHNPFRNLK